MNSEQLKPNIVVRGPIFPEPVRVIVVIDAKAKPLRVAVERFLLRRCRQLVELNSA